MEAIEIDPRSIRETIQRIQREYAHFSSDLINQALSRALNRAAQQSKTAVNKEIRKTYNISAAALNSQLKVRYSQPRTLTSRVVASGSPLSLTMFGAKQEKSNETVKFDRRGKLTRVTRATRRRNPVSGVSFEIKKGNKENLPTAFIQTANGGTTVFARGTYGDKGSGFEFGKARLPIGKMTTTSIPLMFANNDVIIPAGRQAEDFFVARIDHEINWLLSR